MGFILTLHQVEELVERHTIVIDVVVLSLIFSALLTARHDPVELGCRHLVEVDVLHQKDIKGAFHGSDEFW